MDTDESQEELNKQAARLRLNGDKTDGLSSQNLQPEVAENVEDVCSSLTPEAPQDRAVTISRSDTPHQGTTGNHITTDKYSMGEASNGQNTIESVTLFFWDVLTDVQFLQVRLRKLLPMESMSCIPLCAASEDEWKYAASKATYIVFHHSIQSGKSLDEATPYLDFCMETHGLFKIIVMVTGLEDSDSVAVINKWDLSRFNSCHLLLVTKDEMTKFYSTNKGLRTGEREKIMLEAELLTRPHRIGIFSRSAESNYQWFMSLLQSEFRDVVHEVRPCNISNIGAELSQCTVAILYHSMNRGEVNNEELKYMSDILGKENVIVVVEGMKGRFPVEQSIGDYACDLVIITEAEKDKARLMGRLESIRQSLKKPPKRKIRRDEQKEERKKKCPDAEPQQDILPDDPGEMELGNEKNRPKRPLLFIRKHHKIGIFSRSAESDYNWLQTSLRTEFRDLVVDVRACYISNNGRRQFWEDVSQCSVGILYHTLKRGRLNITNVMDSLYEEELKYMAETLGKENVFVVADDLQDSSSIEKHRILAQQPSIGEYSCDLVLLTPADKENKAQKMEKLETIRSALHLKENLLHITRLKTKTSFKQAKDTGIGKIETYQNYRAMVPYTADDTTHLPTGTQEQPGRYGSGSGTQHQRRASEQQPNSQRPGTSERKSSWGGRMFSSWTDSVMQRVQGPSTKEKHKVGIFSRSAEDDYRWLHRFIISEFSDYVQRVRPCYISNTGRRQFWEDVSQCTVAILYHTKKRGRINITDVQGSLYDEELQYLAEQLGKDKVMVVVDDLEDSGPEEKERILMSQRSIGKWASDLILISSTEKNYNDSTNSMYKQWLLQKFNRIAKV
ncbi:uncharacterized protein LOC108703975 isoform X2 [Xenopus laevis]|nr:uncharacterized protein LOC108703975 isoform X2 [Xenopus laevis]